MTRIVADNIPNKAKANAKEPLSTKRSSGERDREGRLYYIQPTVVVVVVVE